eukprot:12404068-Heterocapsa_arctica.AAC.2
MLCLFCLAVAYSVHCCLLWLKQRVCWLAIRPAGGPVRGLPAAALLGCLAGCHPSGELRPGADPRGDACGVNKRLERLEGRDETSGFLVVLLRSGTT